MGTNTNTNTTLLTLRISAMGTGVALPLGRQLKQDFQMNVKHCCKYLCSTKQCNTAKELPCHITAIFLQFVTELFWPLICINPKLMK